MISFEDFQKLELRIGKILSAEKVAGSEKLVKLEVDLHEEKRQIVAGIGKTHGPETLVGREVVIAANLEPKKLMGLESQGMLLAVDIGETTVLLMPEGEVPPGSRVK